METRVVPTDDHRFVRAGDGDSRLRPTTAASSSRRLGDMAANAFDLEHDRRPVGRTRALRSLTRSLDALVGAGLDDTVVATHAGTVLRAALARLVPSREVNSCSHFCAGSWLAGS